MAAKFQNPSSKQQQTKVVVVQQNRWDNALTAMPTSNRSQTVTSKADKTGETKYWNNLLERPREKVK